MNGGFVSCGVISAQSESVRCDSTSTENPQHYHYWLYLWFLPGKLFAVSVT